MALVEFAEVHELLVFAGFLHLLHDHGHLAQMLLEAACVQLIQFFLLAVALI